MPRKKGNHAWVAVAALAPIACGGMIALPSGTAATAVTFDRDGAPTTMPTVVTRATQGLINGFGSGFMTFFCF
jgi:hypothetical protein